MAYKKRAGNSQAALLTLLNAPFLWFSIGLTRGLLRRGLELEDWWPFAFALIDAVLAVLVITVLVAIMVLGVQSFDFMATQGPGSVHILPLEELLQGVSEHPTDPVYWWLYVLLFSTMIPSVINLARGGLSLARGIASLTARLYRLMPERGPVPQFDRVLMRVGWGIRIHGD
jgi:hypothetical protein